MPSLEWRIINLERATHIPGPGPVDKREEEVGVRAELRSPLE